MAVSFTRGDKDNVEAAWLAAKPAAQAAVKAALKYNGGKEFQAAVKAVDDALTPWKLGTLSDTDFISTWDTVAVRSGEILIGNPDDYIMLIDQSSADAKAVNDFVLGLPALSTGFTYTGEGRGGKVDSGRGGKKAGGNTGILLGLAALVGIAWFASREK